MKKAYVMLAIVWTIVGASAMMLSTTVYWNKKILPEMYDSLNKCWSEKASIIPPLKK